MARRDRSAEIIQIKARGGNVGELVSYTLHALGQEWKKLQDTAGIKSDYYLIRAVTILEVFTRTRVSSLVNHGKQYATRSTALVRDLKIDLDLVHSVQGSIITLGDIVAHAIPVNGAGQIVDHFATLLACDMPERLARAVDRWEVEVLGKDPRPIISDYNATATLVSRLFEVRHILCHELPRRPVYDKDEVEGLLSGAEEFAEALETVLNFEMYGLMPLNQTAMNIEADARLRAKEQELNLLLEESQSEIQLVAGESEALQDAQAKWLAYRNAQCDVLTWLNVGGTIRPLLWANAAKAMTEKRMAEVKEWKEYRASP